MIKIKSNLIENAIQLLEYYWIYRDKTPIDYDSMHRSTLDQLIAIREKYENQMEPFKKRLNSIIEDRNISLRTISTETAIPLTTLHNWTKGTNPTDFEAVERLSDFLGVPFEYLMLGDKNV